MGGADKVNWQSRIFRLSLTSRGEFKSLSSPPLWTKGQLNECNMHLQDSPNKKHRSSWPCALYTIYIAVCNIQYFVISLPWSGSNLSCSPTLWCHIGRAPCGRRVQEYHSRWTTRQHKAHWSANSVWTAGRWTERCRLVLGRQISQTK